MRACTVRITKCADPTFWYAVEIGETFEVYPILRDSYILQEDYDSRRRVWRHIGIEDAVEV